MRKKEIERERKGEVAGAGAGKPEKETENRRVKNNGAGNGNKNGAQVQPRGTWHVSPRARKCLFGSCLCVCESYVCVGHAVCSQSKNNNSHTQAHT